MVNIFIGRLTFPLRSDYLQLVLLDSYFFNFFKTAKGLVESLVRAPRLPRLILVVSSSDSSLVFFTAICGRFFSLEGVNYSFSGN